jgi:pyruvate formate lyase activating enzyme
VALGRLEPVLDTLRYLRHDTDVWLEITTLLIPGRNDDDTEIDALTRWVADELGPDVPVHFSAFHPSFKMTDVPCTPRATLARARHIARGNGLRYVYTGNVHDPQGGTTYCPGCSAAVVERDGYVLHTYALSDDGHCQRCDTQIPGRYAGPAGTWGARRVRVRLDGT